MQRGSVGSHGSRGGEVDEGIVLSIQGPARSKPEAQVRPFRRRERRLVLGRKDKSPLSAPRRMSQVQEGRSTLTLVWAALLDRMRAMQGPW